MSSAPPGSRSVLEPYASSSTVSIDPHIRRLGGHNGWIHELPTGWSGRLRRRPCSAPARPTPRTVPSTGNTLVMPLITKAIRVLGHVSSARTAARARPTWLLSMSLWRVLGEHRAVVRYSRPAAPAGDTGSRHSAAA
jgi:hypothetical protein